MNFKYYLIFILTTLTCANCELCDTGDIYLNFFVQIESVKKSIDVLKLRVDVLNENNPNCNCASIDSKISQVFENFGVAQKSLDYLTTRLDAISANDKTSHYGKANNNDNLEIPQKILAPEITEIEEKYSTIMDELNTVKKSVEILKQKNTVLESKNLEIWKNYESNKKSNNELKLEMEALKRQMSKILAKAEATEDYENKPLFDVRVDKLPEFRKHCTQDPAPVDCKAATKCSRKSGYYKIFLPDSRAKQIMVFCDIESHGGDWLHILRRHDGSENFTRSWSDYVNGFGNVEGEHWIGLENLHALTNYNGRQQLYLYIEGFDGQSSFAVYDNFVIGSARELYELKSLGQYYGMGQDDMTYNVGSNFSTVDKDNDKWSKGNCADKYKGGWWYNFCSHLYPTGKYGESFGWPTPDGISHPAKVMYLMIRYYSSTRTY
ncbi:microfibril-associated glycoprotein 4-like [Calliphora vicina]|uniref:microfibril-associated glycoprotein 4-like n=1 Tax=Calliphora vicina TaxID=7373 RepID=UPI00325AB7C8